jgi:hypothetical protein
MFQDALPLDTQTRTRARLDRSGPTNAVLFLNALDWISLALHETLGRILLVTLAIALASRYDLTTFQYLLLLPLTLLLVVEPVVRAGATMHRQLELHQKAGRVWAKPEAELAEKPEN